MTTLEEKILYEIDWRTGEISLIKTIPFLFHFSIKQKEISKKSAIVMMYSLWEGFVVECFSIYAREINNLKLQRHEININILVHSLDTRYSLKTARTDFEKQISFVKNICEHIDGEIDLPIYIPTESNVNFKVINAILYRFNLCLLPEIYFKDRLNKLLFFRNKLAHGENSTPIDQRIIDEMSLTVIASMHAVAERVLEGYANRSYLAGAS